MQPEAVYRLAEGVQVRRESFGLLFYDYRGPRLYFLPSGPLLDDTFFQGRATSARLIEFLHRKHRWPREDIRSRIEHILRVLEEKGLIHGQPIC